MYQRDYVLRLIHQFVLLLARLAGLKAKDDPEIILFETEAGLKQFTGLDPDLIRSLSTGSLHSILTAKDPGDHTPLAAAALLLRAQADARAAMNDPMAEALMQKSQALAALIEEKKLPQVLREHMGTVRSSQA